MGQTDDKSHVEAWKTVTEFAKTVISISSAILTAFIAYYVANQPDFDESRLNYLSPALLVIAIVCAIFAFGRAIKAVKSGDSQKGGVAFANASVVFMLAGVLAIATLQFKKSQSLDVVLAGIEKETASLPTPLSPGMAHKVLTSGDDYLVTFRTAAGLIAVTYASKTGRITRLEPLPGEATPPEKLPACCCAPKIVIKKPGKQKPAGRAPCAAPPTS